MPKQKRLFKVWVEVSVDVEAFDAESAQKKADRFFSSKRELAEDVTLNGQHYSYAPERVAV